MPSEVSARSSRPRVRSVALSQASVVPGPGRLRQGSPPQLSHQEDTVLGFRVHRMLPAEFLQAAQVTVYDYYEPCEQGPGDGSVSATGRGLRRAGPRGRVEEPGQEGEVGRGREGPGHGEGVGKKGARRNLNGLATGGMAFMDGLRGGCPGEVWDGA